MKFREIIISKSELDKLSKEERIFFVQISHIMHELSIIFKCLIATNNVKTTSSTAHYSAQIAQSLYFIKTLAGILNEGWNVIGESYFKTKLSKKYDPILPNYAKRGLIRLKAYFKGDNIVNDIRNKFSFHYDSDEIDDVLAKVPEKEKIKIFVSKYTGNTFHEFSETIANRALLNSIDPLNHQKAMDTFFDDVAIKVPKYLRAFTDGFIVACLKQLHFTENILNINNLSAISTIELPYFCEKNDTDI